MESAVDARLRGLEAAKPPAPEGGAEPESAKSPVPEGGAEPEAVKSPVPEGGAEPEAGKSPAPEDAAEPEAEPLAEPDVPVDIVAFLQANIGDLELPSPIETMELYGETVVDITLDDLIRYNRKQRSGR